VIDRLPVLIAALWWGSLSTVGCVVVPVLFTHLASPAIAGNMAGRLFSAQTWITLASGLLLLMLSRPRGSTVILPWAKTGIGWVAAGMLFAMLLEFFVSPHIVARDNLKLWHSLGSLMYFGQWLCSAVVMWRLTEKSAHHAL